MVMDPPGGRDERRRQAERLRREEAYYHFINELSEEEYRLMRDSNLLGTPGEVTAEELRQRLDGAKERVSSQPRPEAHLQNSETGQEGSSGAAEPGTESANGDSLLEWLNTFRRTGNATRSGQSGNQTWRAVSRTNPNSGEFRFSLEININHEQPEPGEHSDVPDPADLPVPPSPRPSASIRAPQRPVPYTTQHPAPYSTARPTLGRRAQARRTRSSTTPPITPPLLSQTPYMALRRNLVLPHPAPPPPPQPPPTSQHQSQDSDNNGGNVLGLAQAPAPSTGNSEGQDAPEVPECPDTVSVSALQGAVAGREARTSRTRSRGRVRRVAGSGGLLRSSRRSRSPLDRNPAPSSSPSPSRGTPVALESDGSMTVAMETGEAAVEAVSATASTDPAPPTEEGEATAQNAAAAGGGAGSGARRHPTIMLDLQVRRIRPGENRDRDSIASRTRSRARAAENTVTFESDSGGFRRTISRSERAGIRTYVSTIRIPLRRISETGLGEPSSTALRSILRQIMTGFGELSSLMETEADSESAAPGQTGGHSPGAQGNEGVPGHQGPETEREGGSPGEVGQRSNGGDVRPSGRDTNNLVENGTLPILRLAHFFLLNDEEDDEHPRGLTKEQIDNLATRTYGQASLEGEQGRACSVCINEYAQGNKLRSLPCAHEFHIHCIDRWLSENNTCPICRQPILSGHQD
ncbi:E3 ubiquitin-protein ligase RNF6 [Astyanax mexicanus]|uniref:RING-type E3 ubiquitin transferase n=1 Tax=Astyanax mexicanus TaxID=7994 RepID=A0A8B9K8U2_ASTMX|nr:E3 ubiquitin-protein ligase RNF6 [Astyanax mexicanus]